MKLIDHLIDTLKEWELKLGRINSDIRLYYPPDSVRDFLELDMQTTDTELLQIVSNYLKTEAPFLADTRVEMARDHRVGIVIPKEGSDYVASHVTMPEFLTGLLITLKEQNLDSIRDYFASYAKKYGADVVEDQEEDGIGTVLYFDTEKTDPYVYCFDSDDFGVTYHRFSRKDYDKLKGMTK